MYQKFQSSFFLFYVNFLLFFYCLHYNNLLKKYYEICKIPNVKKNSPAKNIKYFFRGKHIRWIKNKVISLSLSLSPCSISFEGDVSDSWADVSLKESDVLRKSDGQHANCCWVVQNYPVLLVISLLLSSVVRICNRWDKLKKFALWTNYCSFYTKILTNKRSRNSLYCGNNCIQLKSVSYLLLNITWIFSVNS